MGMESTGLSTWESILRLKMTRSQRSQRSQSRGLYTEQGTVHKAKHCRQEPVWAQAPHYQNPSSWRRPCAHNLIALVPRITESQVAHRGSGLKNWSQRWQPRRLPPLFRPVHAGETSHPAPRVRGGGGWGGGGSFWPFSAGDVGESSHTVGYFSRAVGGGGWGGSVLCLSAAQQEVHNTWSWIMTHFCISTVCVYCC